MTRRALWLALGLPGVLGAIWGCSRPSSVEDAAASASATRTVLVPPSPASAAIPEPPASPSRDPVLTPEDAEDDAAHRITDQNLESELDRLEREIQAE